jgi:sugar phosphate isomerase/epimerase
MHRRTFLKTASLVPVLAAAAPAPARVAARKGPRVGAVAYAYNYSLGLFAPYNKRPGPRWDVFTSLARTHEAGGEVAQVFFSTIDQLDDGGLRRLRAQAESLDVRLEVHGGVGLRKDFDRTLRQAAALGVRMVGCSFGFLMRPGKIATLAAWDEHVAACEARLRQLIDVARPLGIVIGVENHLDFTVAELRDLVRKIDSPHVGIVFDVGNTIGTLDDPAEAADLLGPHVVATHFKDFAIEETAQGFRFTMVPLGCGSLQLPEILRRLRRHVPADANFAIEMMNGQQFEVNWLEDRFWTPFRPKPAREIAATLRHVRGKAIDRSEFKPQSEVDLLPHDAHVQFEQDRITRCIAHLKQLLAA